MSNSTPFDALRDNFGELENKLKNGISQEGTRKENFMYGVGVSTTSKNELEELLHKMKEQADTYVCYQKQVMNPAVASFGIHKMVSSVIGLCKSEPNLPLVSVGCGIGLIERGASQNVKNEFILVDPAPHSYYPKLADFDKAVKICGLPVTHATTLELLAQRPELANGQSLLLLNWCDYEGDAYDVEAITLLKPKYILAIYETNGSAGSAEFHTFVKTTTSYHKDWVDFIVGPTSQKYPCMHTGITKCLFKSGEQANNFTRRMPHLCEIPHDDSVSSNVILMKQNADRIIGDMSAFANNKELVVETARDPAKLSKFMDDVKMFLSIYDNKK